MLGVVGVVEAEAVLHALLPERLLDLRGEPVGLPREGFDVHQGLEHDHLSLEVSSVQRATPVRGTDGPDEGLALRVDGIAVAALAELVPAVHVGGRHVVPMERLERQVPGVVERHRITDLRLVEETDQRVGNHHRAIGRVDRRGLDQFAGDHEIDAGQVTRRHCGHDDAVRVGELLRDRRRMLDACRRDGRRRIGAEVPRLAPEVRGIGGFEERHVPRDQGQGAAGHGLPVPPPAHREPEPGRLLERTAFLVTQPCVRVAASPRVDRVHDLRELVAGPEDAERVDAHGEDAGDRVR